MENSDEPEYLKTWVFVDPNTSTSDLNKKYNINCLQEPIQELNENDLIINGNTEIDSESDGISVISDCEDSAASTTSTYEDVKEEVITTSDLANQISEIQMKMVDSKKKDNNYPIIYFWLLALTLLLIAIILTQIINEKSGNESPLLNEDFLNQPDFLADTDSILENHLFTEDQPINEPKEYKLKLTLQRQKLVNKENQDDYKFMEKGRLNVIKKEKLVHGKQSKYKNKYESVDPILYINNIIKDKESYADKKRYKTKENNEKYNFMVEKEKQLELHEAHLKRKEKFLLNKEYKLLQKEIELEKRMANQKESVIVENDNQEQTERKLKKKSIDGKYVKVKKGKHKNKKFQEHEIKQKYNKTSGEWFNKMHTNREVLRKSVNDNTIWFLDNSQRNKIKNKARWYFQWMEDRENSRFKRGFRQKM